MLDDALAHGECEVEATEGGIALFEPGDDAEGMQVVVESERVLVKGCVEGLFACVAEGRVADIVGECEGVGEFVVKAESGGDGAGDLGDFEGVGEAAAEVVAGQIAGDAGEDLSFSGEAAEGASVQDAGAVACERRSIRVVRFGMLTGGEVSRGVDGDGRRQQEIVLVLFDHPDWIRYRCAGSPGLVITH
jgi:hypothetical protein